MCAQRAQSEPLPAAEQRAAVAAGYVTNTGVRFVLVLALRQPSPAESAGQAPEAADPALTKFARANRTSWEQAASAERPAVGPPPPSY